MIRLDADLKHQIEAVAKQEDRSMSYFLGRAARFWLDHHAIATENTNAGRRETAIKSKAHKTKAAGR